MTGLRSALDVTALGWVKPDLDEILRQARLGIEACEGVEPGEAAWTIRECIGQLHQVRGTLRMLELDAPALVAEEMERVAMALGSGQVPAREPALRALHRGTIQLPDYLDRLQDGHREIPIVLLPLLNELRDVRGAEVLGESALFAAGFGDVFALDAPAPSEAELAHAQSSLTGLNRELIGTVSAMLKEDLDAIQDALDLHLRGERSDVAELAPQVQALDRAADTVGMLGRTQIRELLQDKREALRQVVDAGGGAAESRLLDIASALLQARAALDAGGDGRGDGGEGGASPAMAQRELVAALAREAVANFSAVRQALVAFVETGWQHLHLADVPRLFHEVAGALRMLGREQAVATVEATEAYVQRELIAPQRIPDARQLDTLADAVSSLEYYLEAMAEQRGEREDILEITRNSLQALRYWPLPEMVAEATPDTVAADEASASDEGVPATDAQTDAQADVGDAAGADAAVVTADEVPTLPPDVAATVPAEVPLPPLQAAPTPSAAAPAAASAADMPQAGTSAHGGFEHAGEEIDDEIREVFLEEFGEEIDNLSALLPAWREAPGDGERLRPVRRVFHTLKGSGRLVGARDLGEFCWKIENMLNRVLDGSRPASPAVLDLVEHACATLPRQHAALRGRRDAVNAEELAAIQAHADRLAAGEEAMYRAPVAAVQFPPAAAEDAMPQGTETPPDAVVPVPAHAGVAVNIDPVLLEILDVEVAGHLRTVDDWVARAPFDATADDALMRAIHTMSGAFAMAEVPVIGDALLPAEGLVKRLLSARRSAGAEGIEALADLASAVRATMATLQAGTPRVQPQPELAARLVALRDALPEAQSFFRDSVDEELDDAMPTAHADAVANELAEAGSGDAGSIEDGDREPGVRDVEYPVAASDDAIALEADAVEDHELEADGLEFGGNEGEVLQAESVETEGVVAESPETLGVQSDGSASDDLRVDAPEAAESGLEQSAAADPQYEDADAEVLVDEEVLGDADEAEESATDHVRTGSSLIALPSLAEAEADSAAPGSALIVLPQAPSVVDDAADAALRAQELEDFIRLEDERLLAMDAERLRLAQERAAAEARQRDLDAQLLEQVRQQAEPLFAQAAIEAAQAAALDATPAQSPLASPDSEDAESRPATGEESDAEASPDTTADPVVDTDTDADADARADAVLLLEPPEPPAALEQASEPHPEPEPLSALQQASVAADADTTGTELADVTDTSGEAETVVSVGASPDSGSGQPAIEEMAAPLDATDMDLELVDLFTEEAADLLDHSDGMLDRLRRSHDDRDALVGLQRNLHTIKGAARMAGVMAVGELGHAMETLLEAVVEHQAELGITGVSLLEQGFDRLHAMVSAVEKRQAVESPQAMVDAFDARARIATAEATQTAAADGDATQPAAPLPALSAPIPADGDVPEDDIVARAPQEQVRIRADLLDRLVNYAGEVAIYRARLEQQLGAFRGAMAEMEQTNTRLHDQLRRLDMETEAQIIARYQREQDRPDATFDPLELDRFSTLQQLARALGESANDLSSLQGTLEDLTRQYETLLLQQSRVSSDLQEGLMRTRMVPFAGLVPRLRRVVRQAAADTGKSVQLQLHGTQGELDRNVLERMTAPLEHMLRNAVAHGLETPAQRIAAGKPEEGRVSVTVRSEGSEVVLEVADDGAGIDREAVRRRAEERGLARADAEIPDAVLDTLILQPGFSTTDTVSRVAGRGVGMDVVASEVRQLGGSIDIRSERGRGSGFTLRLPQMLAVTEAVFVRIGETVFAVPIASVRGVGRIPRDRLQGGEAAYAYGGEEYSVHDLGLLLGQAPARAEGHLQMPVLLIGSGDLRAAVCVDEVVGNREIVVKPAGPQIASLPGIFGATILGDGSVVVILDIAPLVRRQTVAPGIPQVPVAAVPVHVVPLVMVVDDSVTMRKVTGRVLERHGYEVLTARDGVDALERMVERVPDLMLLDIEMPRMDGYELATEMRADRRLRDVPIIMITSRTGEKHRERAFQIGVQRYLGKPYQEAELMRNVQELLEEQAQAVQEGAGGDE